MLTDTHARARLARTRLVEQVSALKDAHLMAILYLIDFDLLRPTTAEDHSEIVCAVLVEALERGLVGWSVRPISDGILKEAAHMIAAGVEVVERPLRGHFPPSL